MQPSVLDVKSQLKSMGIDTADSVFEESKYLAGLKRSGAFSKFTKPQPKSREKSLMFNLNKYDTVLSAITDDPIDVHYCDELADGESR